jgi:hypothetical protein
MAETFEQQKLAQFKIVVTDAEQSQSDEEAKLHGAEGTADSLPVSDLIRQDACHSQTDTGDNRYAHDAGETRGQSAHASQVMTYGLPVDPFIESMRPEIKPYNWDSGYEFYTFSTDSGWQTWWNRRGRQLFNTVYFAAGIWSLYIVAHTSEFLRGPARFGILIFSILMVAAFVHAVFNRARSSSYSFSEATQKRIRRVGLAIPLMAMVLAGWNCLAYGVEQFSGDFIDKDGFMTSRDYITWRGDTIGAQLALSPWNTALQKRLFRESFTLGLHEHSLKIANRMTFFNPRSISWKVKRLAVLGRMPEREAEYNRKAAQYKVRYANYGTLWNTLADVAMIKQNWNEALELSNQHIKLHENEPRALEQRASIYSELGRTEEANADLAAAMIIRESWRNLRHRPQSSRVIPDNNLRSVSERY